jgi:hypothetical protein
MKTLAVVLVLLAATLAMAQAPDALWMREYGGPDHDQFRAVKVTADGGYIAAGFTSSYGAGSYDFYLVKTDADGDTEWTSTYGGENEDKAYAVCQTDDGGYIVAGGSKSFSGPILAELDELDPVAHYDFFVVKTTSTGSVIWQHIYGGTNHDEARGIQQTADGGYIIVGYTQSFGSGDKNIYAVKTDANGDTMWTHVYGGSQEDQAFAVEQTSDLGFAIAGFTKSYGAGQSDFYLIKTNGMGVPQWTHTYGGAANDEAYAMKIDYDGGFVLAGYTASFGAGSGDFYLVKTDDMGVTVWTHTYGTANDERAYGIDLVSFECGYILVGYAYTYNNLYREGSNDLYIVRVICNGDICWTRRYGGESDDWGYGVGSSIDSTYIIAGAKFSGPGPSKAWLIKMEPDLPNCDCTPLTSENFDMGDLPECNYPTLIGNPAHGLTNIAWLGATVTSEGAPYGPGLDGGDDGVVFNDLPWMPCDEVSVAVTITGGQNYHHYAIDCDNSLYLNAWKDGNLDGDFCDTLCDGAMEWIIQDEVVVPGTFNFSFIDPGVTSMGIYDGVFRFRLTSRPVGAFGFGHFDPQACPDMCSDTTEGFGADFLGEVEDYIVENGQLAVELTSFEAVSGDGQVVLRWSTASETDNDHFTIYKRTIGGNFATLAQVPGSGTSSQLNNYEYVDRSVINGTAYEYRLADVDINGHETIHETIVTATPASATPTPEEYMLNQNYPNPFNPSTMIRFSLKDDGKVTLKIFNLLGQEVATLVDQNMKAGQHSISWNASNLPTGIYLYQLEAGDYHAVKKMLYLK